MNNQEVKSAINDFRKAFRDDLGSPFSYGKFSSVPDGGFSIDAQVETVQWVGVTSTNAPLHCTVQTASEEELTKAGLTNICTGIITCIFEDILDLQDADPDTGVKMLKKETITKDQIRVVMQGVVQDYKIVDTSFAFQLRDTFIFIKLGVVSL